MSLSPERLAYHREWRSKNRDRLIEKEAVRRARRGDELREYNARYYEQHREVEAEQSRLWYESHRAEVRDRLAEKMSADPIGVRAVRAADKSKRKFGEYVAWEVYARLFREPCVTCGVTPSMGVDHVVEFADGGRNIEENLQSMCLRDNQRKAGSMRRAWRSRS